MSEAAEKLKPLLAALSPADRAELTEYLHSLDDARIRPLEVPASERLTLGALRNLSLSNARGKYVAQWDDDDWSAPTRLAEQTAAICRSGTTTSWTRS